MDLEPYDHVPARKYADDCTESVKYIEATMILQRVENTMASAIGWMFSMLENMKIIVPPTRSDSEAQLRQEARLKPFMNVVSKDKAEMLNADVECQKSRRPGHLPLDKRESGRAISHAKCANLGQNTFKG